MSKNILEQRIPEDGSGPVASACPAHPPPQPQARLHWIQNLVLKQDTEELKKISEKIYVVLTTMVHAY